MKSFPRHVAVVGDATSPSTWSGTPFHFLEAVNARGHSCEGWKLSLSTLSSQRRLWNLRQGLLLRGVGGFQYSDAFLDRLEAFPTPSDWEGGVLTFSQHFPRGTTATRQRAALFHYVDASLVSLFRPGGIEARLPKGVREDACRLEIQNYQHSRRVVTMARWAADDIVSSCGVAREKVSTVLPGANLALPGSIELRSPAGLAGKDRSLVLGFVGKDWRRKGLPFLLEVRDLLETMGVRTEVHAAGNCPEDLRSRRGLHFVGFIDKKQEPERFLQFLSSCDLGCLFSEHEPLGLSTLEFLRAGVPVAGFVNEGLADTLPPDAGFRFAPKASAREVAEQLREGYSDEALVERRREMARRWSPFMTWERCVAEWTELLETGAVANPVQPWKGLSP